MNLNDEVLVVKFILKMAETLFKNHSTLRDFAVNMGNGKELSLQVGGDYMLVRWRDKEFGERKTVFCYDAPDYSNIMARDVWTFNFHTESEFGHKYSVVNSAMEEYLDVEDFIDSLSANGRMITEEEYFQASLVHPEMPSTYEDTLLILRTLQEGRKHELKDVSVAIYMDKHIDMSFVRMIRRNLMFKLNIPFE